MKSISKYLVMLLLLSIALPVIVIAGSSNVVAQTATATPTPSENQTPTFAPFYESIFGVRIFPGADPIGAYSVNVPAPQKSGTVSGYVTVSDDHQPMSGIVVYLSDSAPVLRSGMLGVIDIHKPIGSLIATTDENGYYEIDNVPFGMYNVYFAFSQDNANGGFGNYVDSADPTVTQPNVNVDISLMFG